MYPFYDCSISTSQADNASLQICIALEEVEVYIGMKKSFKNRISVLQTKQRTNLFSSIFIKCIGINFCLDKGNIIFFINVVEYKSEK